MPRPAQSGTGVFHFVVCESLLIPGESEKVCTSAATSKDINAVPAAYERGREDFPGAGLVMSGEHRRL
jgi:hypothetical protein